MTTDPTTLTVAQLSARIQARELSPVDVVDAYLARIARHNEKLHAFIDVYDADARLAAEAADRAIRAGHAVGPLHGVPIAIKDLVEIEGRVTTGGSAAQRKRRSTVTATLAHRLLRAGMIVLGKTHTVEFAYGGWGTNQHLGAPWNPWDLVTHRIPGGSSSGSGVAVAARLAPCAIGTDTGGSVRLPAAFCGISSLKTTVGRISTHGVLPLSPTLDSPGPMTQSIEDAALLLEVLQGQDPLDPRTFALVDTDARRDLHRGVTGLRLARIPAAERAGVDADVLAAYDRAIDCFASLGAEIVELSLPRGFREYGAANGLLMSAECYAEYSELVDDPAQALDEAVRPRVQVGAGISSHEYLRLLAERRRLQDEYRAATSSIDAVLVPTTLTPAIPIAEVDESTTPAMLTRWVNFMDLTAVAVPSGATAAGLPVSLQVVCQGGAEALALRIGQAWQQATDWHRRVPRLE